MADGNTGLRMCRECNIRQVWRQPALKCSTCIKERTAAMRERRRAHYIPQSTRASVRDEAGGACLYCGGPGSEIDHVVPIVNGGSSDVSNLVWACRRCNRSKCHRGAPSNG